jgi:hypothetical protein
VAWEGLRREMEVVAGLAPVGRGPAVRPEDREAPGQEAAVQRAEERLAVDREAEDQEPAGQESEDHRAVDQEARRARLLRRPTPSAPIQQAS